MGRVMMWGRGVDRRESSVRFIEVVVGGGEKVEQEEVALSRDGWS